MAKREQKQKKQPKTEKAPKTEDKETERERSDFGGLPQRDLKKNLGCG
jgi:hypothetical protein